MDRNGPPLFVIENHDQLYHIWSQGNARSLRVCHLDFHCDLRGLLVDRAKQLAYRIPDIRSGVDIGNFLTHAIVEGMVAGIDWIHGIPGGRACDVNTVKYTEDISSLPYNVATRLKLLSPIPLEYSVHDIDSWLGPAAGDFLDIDWDTFAEHEIQRAELDERVEVLFAKQLEVPLSGISVCYSPGYSHDTQAEFERFVKRVEERFGASRVVVPETTPITDVPWYRRAIPQKIYPTLQAAYYEGRLWLRRRGIY